MAAVSLIVPIYNVEKYLEKCLQSIEKQIFDDYEVILVDDGSIDNSRKIAELFIRKDPSKFKLIHQENQGLSGARNKGLLYATGEYICFADSDDYLEPLYLKEMYDQAKKNDADMVFCAFASVNEQGNFIKEIHEQGFMEGETYSIYGKPELLLIQNAAWNKMYKRSIISKNGLLFTSNVWYEDLRFVKKYMAFCERCIYCDKVLYNYLIRSGSIMNSMASERNLEIIGAIQEIQEFYQKELGTNQFWNEIEFIAIDHMYISTTVRLIRAHGKNYKELIGELVDKFKREFPNYKKNPYISKMDKRRKIVFHLLNLKMYNLIYILFAIAS